MARRALKPAAFSPRWIPRGAPGLLDDEGAASEDRTVWARLVRRAIDPLHLRLEFEAVEGELVESARAWRIDQLARVLEPGDRLEVTILLRNQHHERRTTMAEEQRLTEVLDQAAGKDPRALVEALRKGEGLDEDVRKAIARDAKLRNKDEAFIRTEIAVPYLEAKAPQQRREGKRGRNDERREEPTRAEGGGEQPKAEGENNS